jgi:HK97 gp10 family phage protein
MSRNESLTAQSKRLEQRLEAVPAEILAALRPALMRSGEKVATNMRTFAEASRDTGNLIDSIAVTGPGETTPAYAANGGKRMAGPNQVLVTVGDTDARYGHMIEFGTSKMEAQPFMLPGWRTAKPIVQRWISRSISVAIKKAGRP